MSAPAPALGSPPITTTYLDRVVASSTDRVAWVRERSRGVTATDAAKLSGPGSVRQAVFDKLHGAGFSGSIYTEYGREREPIIAAWASEQFGFEASTKLFHAATERRHLATPDGIRLVDGQLELCEIKTSTKPWRTPPRKYLRQVWWQQHVLGAERTLLVWEVHHNFVPVADEPEWIWVDRDDREIAQLVGLADLMLEALMRSENVG